MRRAASYAERLALSRRAKDGEARSIAFQYPAVVAHRYKMSDKGCKRNKTVATVLASGMMS